MTVNSAIPNISYLGDDVTLIFTWAFRILDDSDLKVYVDTIEKVQYSDYTLENVTEAGGEVHFFIAPADESDVQLTRITPRTQQVDYEPFSEFPADTHEWALDKLCLTIQEMEQRIVDFPNPYVYSVFGRVGDVVADITDYDEFYADLGDFNDLAAVAVTADDTFGLDTQLLVSDGVTRKAKSTPVTVDEDGNLAKVESILLNINIDPHPAWIEGLAFYDEHDKCLVVYNEEEEVTQQLGRETFIRCWNDNGVTIENGKPCSVVGTNVDGDPLINLTDASNKLSALAYIGISTHSIEPDTFGYVTITGAVRGIDTSGLITNAPVWVDPDVVGGYIQTPPPSPAWEVRVGGVSKSHASEGIIYSRPRVFNNTQSAFKFFNGSILESPVLVVESDGATATCELKHPDLVSDISLLFNEEFVTPPGPYIATLTSGTDEIPIRNWVYFLESTELITVSLSGFPTTEQFVPVADIICQSAPTSQTDGFYKVHAWTDHLADATGQGHLSGLNAWIRNRPASWTSRYRRRKHLSVRCQPSDHVLPTCRRVERHRPGRRREWGFTEQQELQHRRMGCDFRRLW